MSKPIPPDVIAWKFEPHDSGTAVRIVISTSLMELRTMLDVEQLADLRRLIDNALDMAKRRAVRQ